MTEFYFSLTSCRPGSEAGAEAEELQLQIHELRAVFQATEVERDRLSELVKVLESR